MKIKLFENYNLCIYYINKKYIYIMNFGQFLTYKGTNLDLVKTYAKEGNLIFAEITEGDDKGFYIFGGKAEGHLVFKADFDALLAQVTELVRLNDMPMAKDADGNDTEVRMTVVEYVTDALKNLADAASMDVIKEVRPAEGEDGKKATDDALPTELAVRTAIDSAVSAAITSLGTVLEFKGVLATKPATDTYKHGDFIIVDGTEYVLVETTTTDEGGQTVTTKSWEEIGVVKEAEAVISIGGASGVVTISNGLTVTGQDLSINLSGIAYAPIFKETVDGVEKDVDYSAIFGEEGDASVTNVKEALDDLYKDHKVISAALNDLSSRVTTIETTLAGLDTVSVTGDAGTYSDVEEVTDAENNTITYTVKNTLAKHSEGVEDEEGYVAPVAGLATDAYVAEAIRRALAWQVIEDEVPEVPAE